MIGWREKKLEKGARAVFKGYSLSVGGSPPNEAALYGGEDAQREE